MNLRFLFYGTVLLLLGSYMIGSIYLFSNLSQRLITLLTGIGTIVSFIGLIILFTGLYYPRPVEILRTGDESYNIACDFKSIPICNIRFEASPNEKLLEEIVRYYTEKRKYTYEGLEGDTYYFHRKPVGLRGLWSKSVWVEMIIEENEDRTTTVKLVYLVGFLLNPFLRGEVLNRYIEAEVYGLYRHIRSNWSKIFGEVEVEKYIRF